MLSELSDVFANGAVINVCLVILQYERKSEYLSCE